MAAAVPVAEAAPTTTADSDAAPSRQLHVGGSPTVGDAKPDDVFKEPQALQGVATNPDGQESGVKASRQATPRTLHVTAVKLIGSVYYTACPQCRRRMHASGPAVHSNNTGKPKPASHQAAPPQSPRSLMRCVCGKTAPYTAGLQRWKPCIDGIDLTNRPFRVVVFGPAAKPLFGCTAAEYHDMLCSKARMMSATEVFELQNKALQNAIARAPITFAIGPSQPEASYAGKLKVVGTEVQTQLNLAQAVEKAIDAHLDKLDAASQGQQRSAEAAEDSAKTKADAGDSISAVGIDTTGQVHHDRNDSSTRRSSSANESLKHLSVTEELLDASLMLDRMQGPLDEPSFLQGEASVVEASCNKSAMPSPSQHGDGNSTRSEPQIPFAAAVSSPSFFLTPADASFVPPRQLDRDSPEVANTPSEVSNSAADAGGQSDPFDLSLSDSEELNRCATKTPHGEVYRSPSPLVREPTPSKTSTQQSHSDAALSQYIGRAEHQQQGEEQYDNHDADHHHHHHHHHQQQQPSLEATSVPRTSVGQHATSQTACESADLVTLRPENKDDDQSQNGSECPRDALSNDPKGSNSDAVDVVHRSPMRKINVLTDRAAPNSELLDCMRSQTMDSFSQQGFGDDEIDAMVYAETMARQQSSSSESAPPVTPPRIVRQRPISSNRNARPSSRLVPILRKLQRRRQSLRQHQDATAHRRRSSAAVLGLSTQPSSETMSQDSRHFLSDLDSNNEVSHAFGHPNTQPVAVDITSDDEAEDVAGNQPVMNEADGLQGGSQDATSSQDALSGECEDPMMDVVVIVPETSPELCPTDNSSDMSSPGGKVLTKTHTKASRRRVSHQSNRGKSPSQSPTRQTTSKASEPAEFVVDNMTGYILVEQRNDARVVPLFRIKWRGSYPQTFEPEQNLGQAVRRHFRRQIQLARRHAAERQGQLAGPSEPRAKRARMHDEPSSQVISPSSVTTSSRLQSPSTQPATPGTFVGSSQDHSELAQTQQLFSPRRSITCPFCREPLTSRRLRKHIFQCQEEYVQNLASTSSGR